MHGLPGAIDSYGSNYNFRSPDSKPNRSGVHFFRRPEDRAVAMLIARQFRYDVKFKMAVLSILPLTVFYESYLSHSKCIPDRGSLAAGCLNVFAHYPRETFEEVRKSIGIRRLNHSGCH